MRLILGAVIFLLFSSTSFGLVPVVDMKSFFTLMKNIRAINNLKSMAHNDLMLMKHSFDELNPMHLASDSLKTRSWSGKTWTDALTKSADSSLSTIRGQFLKKNQDLITLAKHSMNSPVMSELINGESLMGTVAIKEYGDLDEAIHRVNKLSNKCSQAGSLKAALDINNKLLVEIAYLQIEMLRLKSISSKVESIRLHNVFRKSVREDQFLGTAKGDGND